MKASTFCVCLTLFLTLIVLIFIGIVKTIKKPETKFDEQAIVDYNSTTFKPKKVAEIEGRDLYMIPVRPWGEAYQSATHYIYYFKDGDVKSVNYSQQYGKQPLNTSITIDDSPYKRQEVPNE